MAGSRAGASDSLSQALLRRDMAQINTALGVASVDDFVSALRFATVKNDYELITLIVEAIQADKNKEKNFKIAMLKKLEDAGNRTSLKAYLNYLAPIEMRQKTHEKIVDSIFSYQPSFKKSRVEIVGKEIHPDCFHEMLVKTALLIDGFTFDYAMQDLIHDFFVKPKVSDLSAALIKGVDIVKEKGEKEADKLFQETLQGLAQLNEDKRLEQFPEAKMRVLYNMEASFHNMSTSKRGYVEGSECKYNHTKKLLELLDQKDTTNQNEISRLHYLIPMSRFPHDLKEKYMLLKRAKKSLKLLRDVYNDVANAQVLQNLFDESARSLTVYLVETRNKLIDNIGVSGKPIQEENSAIFDKVVLIVNTLQMIHAKTKSDLVSLLDHTVILLEDTDSARLTLTELLSIAQQGVRAANYFNKIAHVSSEKNRDFVSSSLKACQEQIRNLRKAIKAKQIKLEHHESFDELVLKLNLDSPATCFTVLEKFNNEHKKTLLTYLASAKSQKLPDTLISTLFSAAWLLNSPEITSLDKYAFIQKIAKIILDGQHQACFVSMVDNSDRLNNLFQLISSLWSKRKSDMELQSAIKTFFTPTQEVAVQPPVCKQLEEKSVEKDQECKEDLTQVLAERLKQLQPLDDLINKNELTQKLLSDYRKNFDAFYLKILISPFKLSVEFTPYTERYRKYLYHSECNRLNETLRYLKNESKIVLKRAKKTQQDAKLLNKCLSRVNVFLNDLQKANSDMDALLDQIKSDDEKLRKAVASYDEQFEKFELEKHYKAVELYAKEKQAYERNQRINQWQTESLLAWGKQDHTRVSFFGVSVNKALFFSSKVSGCRKQNAEVKIGRSPSYF